MKTTIEFAAPQIVLWGSVHSGSVMSLMAGVNSIFYALLRRSRQALFHGLIGRADAKGTKEASGELRFQYSQRARCEENHSGNACGTGRSKHSNSSENRERPIESLNNDGGPNPAESRM